MSDVIFRSLKARCTTTDADTLETDRILVIDRPYSI